MLMSNKNKKITTVVVIVASVILAVLAIVSTTQAYLSSDKYANNPTEYQTGLLSIEAVSKSSNISLDNTLPMSDTDGAQTTPYVFTIKNNGNVDYKFNVKLLATGSNSFSSSFIKLKIDDNSVTTLSSLTNSIIKQDVVLHAGETIDISIRIWLSSSTTNNQIGKTFNSKLVIDGQSVYTETNADINIPSGSTSAYDLTLYKGTGVGTIYYKVNGASSFTNTTSNKTISVNSGTTYYYYGVASSGYVMSSCTSSNPCSDTMGTSATTKILTATATKTLSITKGTGIDSIYYKIGEVDSYTSTSSNLSIQVKQGDTYSYYVTPSEGYSVSSCIQTSPCYGTISSSNVSKSPSGTVNSYSLSLKLGTGVSTIYYKINGASSYTAITSDTTLSVKYNTTYYYYGKSSSGYTMQSCTESSPCYNTMTAGTVSRTLIASPAINAGTFSVNVVYDSVSHSLNIQNSTTSFGSVSQNFTGISSSYTSATIECTPTNSTASFSKVSSTSSGATWKFTITNVNQDTFCMVNFS